MGFDAVWISPTALNVQGSTPDGYAYHVSLHQHTILREVWGLEG